MWHCKGLTLSHSQLKAEVTKLSDLKTIKVEKTK